MLKYVDSFTHYICVWHNNSIHLSKFQVNKVTTIEGIRQNVFSYTRVMVIGVGSDFKESRSAFSNNDVFLSLSSVFTLTIIVDPDEMLHNAAFYQGLHYL